MRKLIYFIILAGITVLLGACGGSKSTTMYIKKSIPPKIQYCNDAVGHIHGNAPWILGGNCLCTPTKERFMSYKQEGTVPQEMTYSDFLKLFKEKGIFTDLDKEAINSPDFDPTYVLFGGKSMATPVPGTRAYEEAVTGKKYKEFYTEVKQKKK